MFLAYHTDDVNSKLYKITDFSLIPRHIVKIFDASTAIVAGALIRYAGKNGKCFPRQSTIKEDTGLSSYQITNAIRNLRDMCMIETTKGRFGKLSYTFIWHPHWVGCLKKNTVAEKNTGDTFIPHDLFNCMVLPKTITMCSGDLSANEKVMMAYMLCKIGANGMAWPKQNAIAADLGMTTKTVGALLQKLEDKNAIQKITKPGPWPHTYVAVYHDFFAPSMKYVETKKHPRKILDRLLSILRSNKENQTNQNKYTWSDSVESSQVNHNETAAAEEVVVMTEQEFLNKIPSKVIKKNFVDWLSEIPHKLPADLRLSIAARMVRPKKKIRDKGAYLTTLIRKAMAGQYVVAGLNDTLNSLVQWSYGIARVHE